MGWTKGDLVDQAHTEMILSDGEGFDITPEEKQTTLRYLDVMLATWAGKGIRVGYAFPANPGDSSLNDESGLPDSAVETVYLNLARRRAPSFGKQISAETLKNARDGYDVLLWAAAAPINQQLPNTQPLGAGNKPWRRTRPFVPRPDESPLRINDKNGDLNILQE